MKKSFYTTAAAAALVAGLLGYNVGQAADTVQPATYTQGIVQSVDLTKGTVQIAGRTYTGATPMDLSELRSRIGEEIDVTYIADPNGNLRMLGTADIDADKFRS